MRTRSGRELAESPTRTQQVSSSYATNNAYEKCNDSAFLRKDTTKNHRTVPYGSSPTARKRRLVETPCRIMDSKVGLSSHKLEKELLSDVTDEINSLEDRSFSGDEQLSNVSESSTEDTRVRNRSCAVYKDKEIVDSESETVEFLTRQQTLVKDVFASCGAIGLKNLGNTCFMNSVLQALSNTERFRRFLLDEVGDDLLSLVELNQGSDARMQNTNNKESELKVLILKELRDLLKSLWCSQKNSSSVKLEEPNQVDCGLQKTAEIDETKGTPQVQSCKQSLKRKKSKANFISPDGFLSAVWLAIPPFRSLQQADAQEFLHLMLNRVHFETTHLYSSASNKNWEELKDKTKSSGIRNIFGGCIETSIECIQCGEVSRKEQEFLDLSLSIPKEFVHFSGRRSARIASFNIQYFEISEKSGSFERAIIPSCSLYQCLDLFTEKEVLAHRNKYLCSKCGEYVNAWRTCRLAKLPEVLCVHLLRVYPLQNRYRSSMKVDTHVDFPLNDLRLDKYVSEGLSLSCPNSEQTSMTVYDLCAVIQHHGSGWQSGHYTAFCRHVDGRWYHFNDVQVEHVDESTVRQSEAYILLYSRRSVENSNKN